MNEKLTSKEILEQFVQKSGLSEEQSKNFIDTFQYVFLQAIEQDKIVKISGLGTFQLVWNKPRKSVDVRTQQEIEIAGHYKLTFTPENALKERVNAEFAHLEPKEIELPQSQKESPIEKLSQQAKELKGIIDVIQQDNNKVEVIDVVETFEIQDIKEEEEQIVEEQVVEEQVVEEQIVGEQVVEEQVVEEQIVEEQIVEEQIVEEQIVEEQVVEEQIVEEQIVEEQIVEEKVVEEKVVEEKIVETSDEQPIEQSAETEDVINKAEIAQKQSAIDFFYQKPEPPIEVKANTFDYLEGYEFVPRKRRCWLWWLIILVVLAAAVTAFYFLQPDLAKKYWNFTTDKTIELTQKIGGWFSKPQSVDIEQDTIPIDTIQTDTDTIFADTIKVDLDTIVQPVEMQKTPETSIFDEPRDYTEFITSVTMNRGNTLVKLAEKYYGHKIFWVYIYEANKNKIADPDKISAGLNVKIPKLNEKLIDLNNPDCLKYVEKLHKQYLKR